MRSLAFEPEAADELAEAAGWYEGEKSGLGAALLAEVDDVLHGLRSGETASVVEPHAPADIPMRRVLLRSFPYAVVFLEHGDAVRVIAVAHHRRRPGYWRSRVRR